MCKLENIKEKIHIDIAAGDPITPKEVNYNYKSIFTGENFNLKAYNIETILAEKLKLFAQEEFLTVEAKIFLMFILFTY